MSSTTDTERLTKIETFLTKQFPDWNTTTQQPPVVVVTGDLDQFGIKKIYATKPNSYEFYLTTANVGIKSQFDPQSSLTKNSDGSWKIKSNQVRMGVFAKNNGESTTQSQKTALSQGYLKSPLDWKNYEATIDFKLNGSYDDQVTIYGRSGRHTGDGTPSGSGEQCMGSAYKVRLFTKDGATDIAKEQWHVNYNYTNKISHDDIGALKGKWIRIKQVVYSIGANAKVELWIDKALNNNFTKIHEVTDTGNHEFKAGNGYNATKCGCPNADQVISWGGPEVVFRWDDCGDVDFRNISVREIVQPS